jgi:hypothetical protein
MARLQKRNVTASLLKRQRLEPSLTTQSVIAPVGLSTEFVKKFFSLKTSHFN